MVIKLTHDKIWHPIHIKTQLPTLFPYCVFYSNYPAGGDQSVLWIVPEDKLLQYLTLLNLKHLLFSWQLLFKWDTMDETARKTSGFDWTSLQHLTAKQLHVTGSYIFLDSSTVNHNATNNNDPKYHQLRKLRNIYDMLEILCPFKIYDCRLWLNFKQYICKQGINFGINSYKLCSISKCMNNMDIYFSNSRVGVTANRTVSHANVRHQHSSIAWLIEQSAEGENQLLGGSTGVLISP